MKYDLTEKLKDHKGNYIPNDEKNDSTLYDVITIGLLADVDGDHQPIRGLQKVKRYKLFLKIMGKDSVDLTAEEVAMISDAVLMFPTVVCGQVQEILNQGA